MFTLLEDATVDHRLDEAQGQPCKSIEFQHDLQVPKVMKIHPMATNNQWEWYWNQENPDMYEKLFFAIHPVQNTCFSRARRPDSNPRIVRKISLQLSMKQKILRPQTSFQNMVTNDGRQPPPPTAERRTKNDLKLLAPKRCKGISKVTNNISQSHRKKKRTYNAHGKSQFL